MSTTRLTTVNTQESIHPASTATALDIQPLASPKAPPTPQEIQRKLSVAQRAQKVCASYYLLNLPRAFCCLHSPRSPRCLSAAASLVVHICGILFSHLAVLEVVLVLGVALWLSPLLFLIR
jgi:hypothetical protein